MKSNSANLSCFIFQQLSRKHLFSAFRGSIHARLQAVQQSSEKYWLVPNTACNAFIEALVPFSVTGHSEKLPAFKPCLSLFIQVVFSPNFFNNFSPYFIYFIIFVIYFFFFFPFSKIKTYQLKDMTTRLRVFNFFEQSLRLEISCNLWTYDWHKLKHFRANKICNLQQMRQQALKAWTLQAVSCFQMSVQTSTRIKTSALRGVISSRVGMDLENLELQRQRLQSQMSQKRSSLRVGSEVTLALTFRTEWQPGSGHWSSRKWQRGKGKHNISVNVTTPNSSTSRINRTCDFFTKQRTDVVSMQRVLSFCRTLRSLQCLPQKTQHLWSLLPTVINLRESPSVEATRGMKALPEYLLSKMSTEQLKQQSAEALSKHDNCQQQKWGKSRSRQEQIREGRAVTWLTSCDQLVSQGSHSWGGGIAPTPPAQPLHGLAVGGARIFHRKDSGCRWSRCMTVFYWGCCVNAEWTATKGLKGLFTPRRWALVPTLQQVRRCNLIWAKGKFTEKCKSTLCSWHARLSSPTTQIQV